MKIPFALDKPIMPNGLMEFVKPEAPDGAKNLCTISTVHFSNEIFQD